MKIVIDISKLTYEEIKRYGLALSPRGKSELEKVLKNGTPLPEYHGDLIDRQSLINNGIEKGFCDWYSEIKMAYKIIKANKEVNADADSD